MSAQGWTPGNRLGARDAAHADFLTAASTSHIKVTIKDDTLGLGARAGRDPLGEPTGLDAFKGLLGRLNGQSDVELMQDQRKRDDVKLARYAAMKFPEVRFVRGGLLTQEKVDPLPHPKHKHKQTTADANTGDQDAVEEPDPSSDSTELKRKSSKSKTKSKSKSSKKARPQLDEADSSTSMPEPPKKKKKSKKRKADSDEETTSELKADSQPESSGSTSMARERLPVGRQFFRGRHIAQKKKALLDDKCLSEVSAVLRR